MAGNRKILRPLCFFYRLIFPLKRTRESAISKINKIIIARLYTLYLAII